MGLFDDLLLKAGDDRAVLEKYSELKEWDQKLTEWESWKDANYDPTTRMTRNAMAAIQAKDQEIEALRLLQGNDMTWDEMKTNVASLLNEKGYVTADKLKEQLTAFGGYAKPEDVKKLQDEQLNFQRGAEFTFAKATHLPVKYDREFRDMADAPEFTVEALFNHMTDMGKKMGRPAGIEEAYDDMVKPLRAKKSEAAAKVQEEEYRKQGYEKAREEFAAKGIAPPIDDRGGAPEVTPLQRRIAEKKKMDFEGPKLTPGELGSQAGANDAYSAWLKDQATGKRVQ